MNDHDEIPEIFREIFGFMLNGKQKPEKELPVLHVPERCQYRVKATGLWPGLDPGRPLIVDKYDATHWRFKSYNGSTWNVPVGLLDDFEKYPDA